MSNPTVSLPTQPIACTAPLEETRAGGVDLATAYRLRTADDIAPLRTLLIAARVGILEIQGRFYALTWDAGDV